MNFIRPKVILYAAALFLTACTTPQEQRSLSELTPQELVQALGLANSSWAYHAVDVESGRVVASHLADTPQPPASTAKLPTMIAALGILGADFQFETSITTNGRVVGDSIIGDLIIRGTGDPLLRPNDLRNLAIQFSDLGVRQISGQFLYQSTLPSFPVVEKYQPDTAAYNQGVSGLNVDFNRVKLTQQRSTAGDLYYYFTPAEADGLTPADNLFPDRVVIDVPVTKPGLLAARMFRKFASVEGIALPKPTLAIVGATTDASTMIKIASVKSLPLNHIAKVGLEYSNNMVAEVIGLAANSALGKKPNSLSISASQLTQWLDTNVVKETRFAPFLLNHSGLSTASRITPIDMTNLLHETWHIRHLGQRFDHWLPPAGGREGFRGRFRSPTTAYKVWGKTGSMRYIKGLAGYIDAANGRRIAFSIFTNNLAKRKQFGHARDMDNDTVRADAGSWRTKAEAFESELIRRWISNR